MRYAYFTAAVSALLTRAVTGAATGTFAVAINYLDDEAMMKTQEVILHPRPGLDACGGGPLYSGTALFRADRLSAAELTSSNNKVFCYFFSLGEDGQTIFLRHDPLTTSEPFQAVDGQPLEKVDGVRCLVDAPRRLPSPEDESSSRFSDPCVVRPEVNELVDYEFWRKSRENKDV